MENKNNIAELLKDCPRGTKLYSPLCGECYFDRLNMGTIICKKQNTQEITFTSEGYYMLPVFDDCECVLFPSKECRDWSKLQRPFKDGDIVCTTLNSIAIIKCKSGAYYTVYCGVTEDDDFYLDAAVTPMRLAIEEEKAKLFDAIKKNGYKWNEETKSLEKIQKYSVEYIMANLKAELNRYGDIVTVKISLGEVVVYFKQVSLNEISFNLNID